MGEEEAFVDEDMDTMHDPLALLEKKVPYTY